MNLHSVAAGPVGAVNPRTSILVYPSTGASAGSSGNVYTPSPTYGSPITALAQVQPLDSDELKQLDGLNQQGKFIGVYTNGLVNGIVRATGQGGDKIVIASGPYVGTWLVTKLLEGFDSAGWCKVACTQQIDTV